MGRRGLDLGQRRGDERLPALGVQVQVHDALGDRHDLRGEVAPVAARVLRAVRCRRPRRSATFPGNWPSGHVGAEVVGEDLLPPGEVPARDALARGRARERRLGRRRGRGRRRRRGRRGAGGRAHAVGELRAPSDAVDRADRVRVTPATRDLRVRPAPSGRRPCGRPACRRAGRGTPRSRRRPWRPPSRGRRRPARTRPAAARAADGRRRSRRTTRRGRRWRRTRTERWPRRTARRTRGTARARRRPRACSVAEATRCSLPRSDPSLKT